jgi:hypothetical protein
MSESAAMEEDDPMLSRVERLEQGVEALNKRLDARDSFVRSLGMQLETVKAGIGELKHALGVGEDSSALSLLGVAVKELREARLRCDRCELTRSGRAKAEARKTERRKR